MSGSAGRSLGVVPTSPLSRPLGQSAKCAIFDGHLECNIGRPLTEPAHDPLAVMSEPTLWGHASRVPGRGWRGAVPPLTPPTATAHHGRSTRRVGEDSRQRGGPPRERTRQVALIGRQPQPGRGSGPAVGLGRDRKPVRFGDPPRSQRRSMAFLQGYFEGSDPAGEGGMGVHMPETA